MAGSGEVSRPRRKLRIVKARSAVATPVLTLEEAVALYIGLLQQARQLDRNLKAIRLNLLDSMDELGIESIREEGFEVTRQVRRFPPRLDRDRAEEMLARFGRLNECIVPQLDEDKARRMLEELHQKGQISDDDLPLLRRPDSEILIVRRAA